jgi:hypothetical protein
MDGWLSYQLSNREAGLYPSYSVHIDSKAHTAPYPMCIGVLSLRVQRTGCEADRSPSHIAEAKKEHTYTSTPPHVPWRGTS